jgi:hypothetical protein
VIQYLRKNQHLLILAGIIAVGIFFRTYALVERYGFAHDGDLFSWIVKDIVVDKHFRLIGQQTTAPGIFIGPFFYWMLVPFFLLFKMDPVAALIPITIIGILTVPSYYFVFARLYGTKVGLVAAFLQAVLLAQVWEDRRVVPSMPSTLWSVWYFYSVINIARKNFKVLPLLGILIGLIWHIHIALIPALIAFPVAFLLARSLPSKQNTFGFLLALFIVSIPLILFEFRHNFLQTSALVHNLQTDHGAGTGVEKLHLVLNMLSSTIFRLFLYPHTLPAINHILFTFALLALSFFLLSRREVILLLSWILGVILFFSFSSSPISEYYFLNINVIFIGIVSLGITKLINLSKLTRLAVLLVLIIMLLTNISHYTKEETYKAGYKERKKVAEFIAQDAARQGFPCVAISYITLPGENVGFRYFFWLNNLHIKHPAPGIPIYTIVLPAAYDTTVQYGQIGIITPKTIPPKEEITQRCSGENTNLTDPMLGFTK